MQTPTAIHRSRRHTGRNLCVLGAKARYDDKVNKFVTGFSSIQGGMVRAHNSLNTYTLHTYNSRAHKGVFPPAETEDLVP